MEQTIPKPLSGEEVRKAITYDVDKMFSLDDRFAPHNSYMGYTFTATFLVTFPGAPLQQQIVHRSLQGGTGELGDSPEQVSFSTERAIQPPNFVRQDTEQPIPVLVEEKGALVEKSVLYAKGEGPKQGIPKQKLAVKGA